MTRAAHDFPRAPLQRRVAHTLAMLPRRLTSGLRRLPDFLVIGAQRCGTTSLARALERHPDVFVAPVKEVHYFDVHHDRGLGWYRAHFPLAGSRARVVGEATPYYLFHPLVPARVHAVLPRAKLIALLRDPVDRAWSHYRHELRLGFEDAATFAEAIEREPERLAGEAERLARGEVAFSSAHNHFSYLARGDYAAQLARWLDLFPREQLLVVRSERLFENPAAELARIAAFLGVDPARMPPLPSFNRAATAELDPALRARLAEHFAPRNRALEALLGTDRSGTP